MSENIDATFGGVAEPNLVSPTLPIMSRVEARELRLRHYFTGQPCPRGHIAKRYSGSGQCFECQRENKGVISPRMQPFWSLQEDDYLQTHWGKVSAAKIGHELGRSRLAVIGRAHRIGLADPYHGPRERRVAGPRPQQVKPPPKPIRPPPAIEVTEAVDLPPEPTPTTRVSIYELTDGLCKWPIGDPRSPDFCFCGGMALTSRPYCGHHARLAYQKPMPARGQYVIASPWSEQAHSVSSSSHGESVPASFAPARHLAESAEAHPRDSAIFCGND